MRYEKNIIFLYICFTNLAINECNMQQIGPEPWDLMSSEISIITDEDVPPDLKIKPQKVERTHNMAMAEWFYKRILTIVLKGGQIKVSVKYLLYLLGFIKCFSKNIINQIFMRNLI